MLTIKLRFFLMCSRYIAKYLYNLSDDNVSCGEVIGQGLMIVKVIKKYQEKKREGLF